MTDEQSASEQIDGRIKELGGWRGETLAKVRAIIRQADPEIIEKTVGIEAWMAATFPPRIARHYRKKPFFVATVLLWLTYSAVAVIAIRSGNPTARLLFAVAFAAIVANGLFHVLIAPVFGQTSPGFWRRLS